MTGPLISMNMQCPFFSGDDGEYYAVPLGLSYAGYVWANMSYFDKYNLELPTNYDELKEVCQTFRDNGEYPLVIGAKDSWINIDTWMNIAADINTEKLYSAIEGETPFTDEDLVQSFQIWQNCFTDSVFQDGALGMECIQIPLICTRRKVPFL